jgi:hypothetical protein
MYPSGKTRHQCGSLHYPLLQGLFESFVVILRAINVMQGLSLVMKNSVFDGEIEILEMGDDRGGRNISKEFSGDQ